MTGHDALSGLTEEQQRKLLRVLLEKRAADDAVFPMSIQQRSLWFEYQRDPSWPGFNVCLPSRVRSKLDVDLFHRAMDCLVERHASLRTVFGNRGGEPFQRVQARQPPEFCVVDASEESEDALQELAASESVRPFDLESGPLLRIILFRRAEDDWILIATTHHLVIDFWSLVLLLGEVRILYRDLVAGREISLPTSPNNYASFVQRQRDLLQNSGGEKLRRYWRKQLRETAWFTEFPTDYVRPRRFTGRAASVAIDIPARNVERVAALARSEGVTFPSVLLAILQVFVHRYTGESRFLIGSPFSGRLLREYEETVGFFVNMLPLRANITSETTFAELVGQAGSVFAEALEHEALPLAEIIRDSKAPSDPSRPPLFQVAFTFEKSHRKEEDGRAGYLLGGEKQQTNLGGLEQQSFPVPVQTCHYDLEFIFERNGPTLNAMLCYCRDLFATDSINAFVKNFRSLTEELLNHPIRPIGDLGWSVSNEAKTSNDPRRPRTAGTRGSVSNADTGTAEAEDEQPNVFDGDRHSASAGVTQTFDESPWIFSAIQNVAVNDPQRMALWSGDYRKSYAELVRESLQIAGALAGRGIAANRYVPVVGARGPRVIPAILGVIAAGAVVVPIDAEEPAVSPEELLADTGAKLVIVETDGQWTMPEQASPNDVEVRTIEELLGEQVDHVCETIEPRGDDLCYLIYTSGSSGRPKGVMIEHQAIDNTLRWRKETVPLGAEDRILVLLSHQFDAGFGVMFGSLVQGARLVWPTASAANVECILENIINQSITVLPTIPSLLALIAGHPWFERCVSLRELWTGGERMPSDLPERLRSGRRFSFWNFYGPTEAAIEATAAEVSQHPATRVIPIGKPINDTEVLVLDSELRELPVTVPGELAIHGVGLARGYLGRTDLTAQRFCRLLDGRRVFLTGDRGRKRTDGSFEFLGRLDDQVKVGGYRIELEEIEQVLKSLPLVDDAAVKVREADNAAAVMIAYLKVAENKRDRDADLQNEIKRSLGDRLPPFKRPRHLVFLDSLPKTSSGKIDRKQLPDRTDQQLAEREWIAARNKLEDHLTEQWARMLGLQEVGINEDFFELGGTSLQAAMLATRLSDQLGVHVPTSLLFDMPDVLRTAERLASLHRDALAKRFGEDAVDYAKTSLKSQEPSEPEYSTHPLIATFIESTWIVPDFQHVQKQPGTSKQGRNRGSTPIFMIHPPGGIIVCYRDLAKLAPEGQAFYAVRSRGLEGGESLPDTVEAMAADYVEAIRATIPNGPYQLGGWSLGGIGAWEAARQLVASGESVERIILLDTSIPQGAGLTTSTIGEPNPGTEYGLDFTLEELAELKPEEQLPLLWEHAKNLGILDDDTPQSVVDQAISDLKQLFHHHLQLLGKHPIEPLKLPVLLIRPRDVPVDVGTSPDRGWSAFSPEVTVEMVEGHHHSMVKRPGVEGIARLIFPSR